MRVLATVVRAFLFIGTMWWVLAGAEVQAQERVAIFVAAPSMLKAAPLVRDVQAQLKKDGRFEVRPDIRWPSPLSDGEADQLAVRGLGRRIFSVLGSRPPEDVLREYDASVTRALGNWVGADAEMRGILWNLCVLRVHLLMLAGQEGGEGSARNAALDCSRRFVERPAFDSAWPQDVVRVFTQVSDEASQVPLAVKSSPAGCDVRLYGTVIGVTPVIVDVLPGPQEVQLECGGRVGAIHRLQVEGPRSLVVRFDAERAVAIADGIALLQYDSPQASASMLDDVAALASEAGADSYVLVNATSNDAAELLWVRLPAVLMGSQALSSPLRAEARSEGVADLFNPSEQREAEVARRRSLTDYSLGAGLIAGGAALAVYPALAMARDGRCVDSDCTSRYAGKGVGGALSLVGAGAVAVSGALVLWLAPFGERASIGVAANGIEVKGSF